MPDKKHTPGPWYASSDGTVHWVHSLPVPAVVVTCEDAAIKTGKVVSGVGCKVKDQRGEAAANARLISAAPELLAACEAAIHMAETTGGIAPLVWEEYGVDTHQWTELRDTLRAAIAKATGADEEVSHA